MLAPSVAPMIAGNTSRSRWTAITLASADAGAPNATTAIAIINALSAQPASSFNRCMSCLQCENGRAAPCGSDSAVVSGELSFSAATTDLPELDPGWLLHRTAAFVRVQELCRTFGLRVRRARHHERAFARRLSEPREEAHDRRMLAEPRVVEESAERLRVIRTRFRELVDHGAAFRDGRPPLLAVLAEDDVAVGLLRPFRDL